MINEIKAKVIEYVINASDQKLKPEDVKMELSLKEDLGLDSVGSITAMMDLEEHFDIVIEDKQLPNLHTVGDVVALIESQVEIRGTA